MRKMLTLGALVMLVSITGFASPQQLLYGDNATGGAPYIYQIDPTTGNILNTFTNTSGINGRGAVVVGNILYYTDATDNNVYKYDISTQTNLGVAFSVAGSSALSTMAYDGTNFWIGDYSGTNHAYLYTPTGTLLNTISLANCTGFCDGLEFFKMGGTGYLISNRCDAFCGTYDVYDLNGNLVTPGLITTPNGEGTGIAYDGTHFFVSNIFGGQVWEYSNTGTLLNTLTLTGYPNGFSPLVEDLSFNYQQVLGTPEPGTLVMLGTGVLGLASVIRRRIRL
jgi:sugar lactone lactonase YvrE